MTTDRQIWLGFMRVPGGIMDCDISLERYFQDLCRELILIKIGQWIKKKYHYKHMCNLEFF